jgi:hypothetical protein
MMIMQTKHLCSEIRQLVVDHLAGNLRVSKREGQGCTITLPIKTVDDRWVSVIVEEKFDYFVVHDGGQTDSELYGQGLTMSDSDECFHAAIASKYHVTVHGRMIQKTCRRDELPQTIMEVAEAAAVMTAQLVFSRFVEVGAQEVHGRVSEALRLWKPDDVEIQQNVELTGDLSTHKVNFIAKGKGASGHRTATIKILPPSRPRDRAERYGFMQLDMRQTPEFRNWASLAVILGAETWTESALRIVHRVADKTIELTSDQEAEVEARIPRAMTTLATAELHF